MPRPRPCIGNRGPCPTRALSRHESSRCDACRTRHNTDMNREYGTEHRTLRARYEPMVRAGQAICARCENPIPADAAWDLGHDDNDRTLYSGPEHASCNRGAPSRGA